MKKLIVKLTENEKKKIQFVISCHLNGVPSLKDIQIIDNKKGFYPDSDHMKLKRFDTARKGWTNGYFYISLIGKENVVFLFFGDSEDPKAERRFYFPKEGASPSYEWNFLDSHIDDSENGIKFLNRFSDCLFSCGVECYLCSTECNHLYEVIGRLNDIRDEDEEEEEC